MSTFDKEVWFVAVKVFIRAGEEFLILKDKFADGWDLPGGRLRKDDFETPLTDVLKRKIEEELGTEIEVEIVDHPLIHFRHERHEYESGEQVRIFAVGYEAKYLGGNISLGEYMTEYKWVKISEFNPADYMRGGWQKGTEEYLRKACKKVVQPNT